MINWSDPKAKISKYFTVHEATWLPSWGVHHTPSADEQAAILKTAAWMDGLREFLGRSINVHCWIRPGSVNCPGSKYHGQDYNAFVKGASKSSHKLGRAVDWDCGEDCNVTRQRLMAELEPRKLRMEDIQGPWVHTDDMPVVSKRFFKP